MVNITRTDLGLLLSMFLAVWLISTVMGHAGLVTDDFNSSDPPTLNLSNADVDVAPGPPDPPLSQNEYRVSEESDGQYSKKRFLNDTSWVEVFPCSQFSYPNCEYNYRFAADGNMVSEKNLSANGSQTSLTYDGATEEWHILVTLEDNTTGQSVISVRKAPKETGLINTIVGTAESAYNAIASGVGTLANVLWSVAAQLINTLATAVVLFGTVAFFTVSYIGYVFGGYLAVFDSAEAGWATPVLAIPLIPLSWVMAKIGLVTLESLDPLIPFT